MFSELTRKLRLTSGSSVALLDVPDCIMTPLLMQLPDIKSSNSTADNVICYVDSPASVSDVVSRALAAASDRAYITVLFSCNESSPSERLAFAAQIKRAMKGYEFRQAPVFEVEPGIQAVRFMCREQPAYAPDMTELVARSEKLRSKYQFS